MRRLIFLLSMIVVSGCSVNPVTGERNLNFMSEDWERNIGAQQYAPLRQAQGGDFILDPTLTDYVSGVGQKLAVHAKRSFNYEFHILNDSTPNAWALPGGKIVVNRGLLTELDSEAELAAVLGHEIVHADAAHGARAQSKGTLTQIGALGGMVLLGTQVNDQMAQQIGMLGIQAGAALVSTAYGRDAERESDYFGMQYMSKAGYDPQGAVDLQETFLRLSEGRNQSWLTGLFSSHPPSRERVENNRATLAELPAGGEWGRERYQRMMAYLESLEPAYNAYTEGREAFAEEDYSQAMDKARQAITLEPKEALFHGLVGDVHAMQERYRQADRAYSDALRRNDGFFYYYLRRGQVRHELGRVAEAQTDLERSNALLPTAQANQMLGSIAKSRGDERAALAYFQAAAQDTRSAAGALAQRELVLMELPRNPDKYVRAQAFIDRSGNVALAIGNASPVAVRNVVIQVRFRNQNGQVSDFNESYRGRIEPQQQVSVSTRMTDVSAAQLDQQVAVAVVSAQVAE